MGLFNSADSGRFPYKTGFNMSYEKDMDIDIGKLNIINAEFICPGDIVHVSENILLRFQAQIAPFFTTLVATVRNWFVPLRLIEENTEWIITGSKNGKLMKDEYGAEVQLPTFDKLFDYEKSSVTGSYKIKTGGVVEQMFGLPNKVCTNPSTNPPTFSDLDYSTIKDNRIIPALYWIKAYYRMWFDYYRDENLFDYEDFDDWWTAIIADGKIGQQDLLPVNWKKDYLTSMLYSQQKGIAPVLNPFINNPQLTLPITALATQYNNAHTAIKDVTGIANSTDNIIGSVGYTSPDMRVAINDSTASNDGGYQAVLNTDAMKNIQGGFNASELRLLFAQQKIFERLMRCGSRYVEYLMSNFGTAPADETLQRVQYLGGFKQGIVTSEVLQTAEGSNPVGTQRGHTISAGGNSLGRYHFKEFGIMLTTLSVMPRATYTQGVNRKYCLTERFDFPNPSFQFMSEDEVLNGEVYIDTDVDESGNFLNDKTMGFQEMYAWLKSNRDMVTGNLRGDQKYWVMPREFKERPLLNERFLTSSHDQGNFAQPFAVLDKPPIIMRAGNIVHMWRNFARYGTPGLLDHY